MSITLEQVQGITGKVVDQNSDKVGSIGQIYLDDTSGAPSWVTVKTGLFGTSETFVPLAGAEAVGDDLRVGFSEDTIKNAPRIESDGSLSPAEEDELYRYYGLSDGGTDTGTGTADVVGDDVDRPATTDGVPAADSTTISDDAGVTTGTELPAADTTDDRTEGYVGNGVGNGAGNGVDHAGDEAGTVGHDTSGPTTDDAMTRSEEQLKVGTATREAGKARLRKYVTTETVTQSVPVSHEEVTLEREPITDANLDASQSGPAISEEEHEVVLHEEVPVVDKDVVAVERVKLGKETVTEDATVSEELRKENVELVDPDETPAR